MGNNAYLNRKRQEIDDYIHTTERITRQFDMDTFHIALGRYEKLNLGFNRIMEITMLWEQVRAEYGIALTGEAEADVAREHMDMELLQIAKKPARVKRFERRYPELKEYRYQRRGNR